MERLKIDFLLYLNIVLLQLKLDLEELFLFVFISLCLIVCFVCLFGLYTLFMLFQVQRESHLYMLQSVTLSEESVQNLFLSFFSFSLSLSHSSSFIILIQSFIS